MCTTIHTNYTKQLDTPISEAQELPNDERITNLIEQVFTAKEAKIEASLSKKCIVYDPFLWGGDLTTMAYMGFEGVATASAKLGALSGMVIAGTVLGLLGGVANILVAISTGRELINALKSPKKDWALILQLTFDCIFLSALGVFMTFVSLAQIVSIGGLSAFLLANPWVLPVIFFILTWPLIFNLLSRIIPILTKTGLSSQLKLDDLEKLLKKPNWQRVDEFISKNHPFAIELASKQSLEQHLIEKMEDFQNTIGAKAAVKAFKLMAELKSHNKDQAKLQLEELKKEVSDYKFSLYVRMFQQFLYVLSFALSMVALPLKTIGSIINCADNWGMAAANAIPLYMDLMWPLKRNTPIVVPAVSEAELTG